ncbi:hypothetical protein VTJ83DRAFT_7177 [Remersonia thermophila]|uniref:Chromatin structure-remodeling complex subunit rsc9 n=1 Tax=Remersonia thermophila TaxID=72144 RepID=A0ABR4D2S4_9PEZI
MAPTTKPAIEHTVDRTPEYEKFIEELRVFHEKRGTNFDPEPKMGNLTVDLLKLFKHIVAHGGYDKVSDEKLMWRKMCEGLGLMRHNAPADAYTLKQIFYKNLAAYEIKTIHNKEPPPPEILEFTTAKGGGLLTRTLENYARSKPDTREGSNDEGTPTKERRPEDAPTSSRASRGLREAPPPRVIFHPETHTPRQTRHASAQQSGASGSSSQQAPAPSQATRSSQSQASAPAGGAHHDPHPHTGRGASSHGYHPAGHDPSTPMIQSYGPQAPLQLPLRIVDTPASNPDLFARKLRQRRQLRQPAPPAPNPGTLVRASLPPGTLDGPNIYERCLLALRSGIRAEQAFALYHLVKISFERGDKYKFSQFSGLAEGLTEVALSVGGLFYDVEWTISNDPDLDDGEAGVLDGINGTPDILERIAELRPKDVQDSLQPAELADQMTLITEAVLTIRNMVMLPENAWFISDYPPINALLCILLNLPPLDMVVELKHSALDIAEQITPYLTLDAQDPLYRTLLAQLGSSDRGIILTALRALGRIAMNHPTETNKLGGVPPATLQRLIDWLLLNDDELVDACLDFLYQYTAEVSNMDVLLDGTNVEHLVAHLVRLLSHGAKRTHREVVLSEAQISYVPATEYVVPIPKDLQERLVALEEPDRCYAWLRCFFEEDPEAQITQIAIWQAYNAAFLEPLKRMGRPMINAPEFIRHISTVYQNAGAQVIREGPNGEIQKFIMRGIRPRPHPVTPEGRAYFQCQWQPPGVAVKCGTWNLTAEAMWRHILADHLGETPNEDGKFANREALYHCAWQRCAKHPPPGAKLHLAHFMSHIKTHLKAEEARHLAAAAAAAAAQEAPASPSSQRRTSSVAAAAAAAATAAQKRSRVVVKPAKSITLSFEETASARDERNPNAPSQAAGIPLSAALILRNIARNAGRTAAEERLVRRRDKRGGGGGGGKHGGGRWVEYESQRNGGDEDGGEDGEDKKKKDADEPGGWNERLFRPVMPRLFEVFSENRLLAPYLTNLFQLLA